MMMRHICAGLALVASAAGCCHPFAHRPATVVSSSPVCCPPGEPAVAVPAPVPSPPVQSFSAPPPGATVIR
ncbi:MAG TPA: hypothetical protein VKU02_12645 [Gemmataceae bacterium]|nr:hypothetical protein [Gemmataceae bacterium]